MWIRKGDRKKHLVWHAKGITRLWFRAGFLGCLAETDIKVMRSPEDDVTGDDVMLPGNQEQIGQLLQGEG